MGRPKKITPRVEKAPARLNGSFDLMAEQTLGLDVFYDKISNLAHTFGYTRIETPPLENPSLFKFWEEGNNDKLIKFSEGKDFEAALKPANIFGLARTFIEQRLFERERVTKWYFVSPVAYISGAKELKQAHEYGFQIFGHSGSIADAQIINLLFRLFSEIGISSLQLEINNIGCLECRGNYVEVLRNFLKEKKYDLCDPCLEYLETQPLKVLECSNLSCNTVVAEAPLPVDYICDNCRKHFIDVLEGLDELNVPYNLNPKVIGLPWSSKTVFEIRARLENQEIVLGKGGHANDLIQSLGGPPTQSLGFSGFVENVLLALDQANVKFAVKSKVDVFLVPLGDLAAKKTLRLFTELWSHNIVASEFIGPGSIKTQLKLAESSKVDIALIIGQKEAREGTVILRDVRSGMQELFTVERIIEEVKKRLER